jgi:hypothetical protein
MRRLACLAVTGVLISGCHYASSPLDGFGGFVSDTHLFKSNPNKPDASSENILRAEGQQVAADPLTTEPGNIWPGPPKAEPTLEDVIQEEQPDQSGAAGGGSVTPYGSAAHPQPRPQTAPAGGAITVPPASVATPGGTQPLSRGGGGTGATTGPGGGTSIIVPNGNGTSTIIGPDGSTQTIPTPK